MIALIDGDIVAYRCASSCEPTQKKRFVEPVDDAIRRADELMNRILFESGADSFKMYLSGGQNFRKELYPEYKANRRRIPPPTWLQNVREFLCTDWDAKVIVGYEADDAIGIAHEEDQTVICSNDKDFLQIVGNHFNFVKGIHTVINEEQAKYNYWTQMLIGDKADNVPGPYGYQAVKSAHYFLMDSHPARWDERVREFYNNDEWYYRNRTLLRILRSEPEYNLIRKALDENPISQSEGTEPAEISKGSNPEAISPSNPG